MMPNSVQFPSALYVYDQYLMCRVLHAYVLVLRHL